MVAIALKRKQFDVLLLIWMIIECLLFCGWEMTPKSKCLLVNWDFSSATLIAAAVASVSQKTHCPPLFIY